MKSRLASALAAALVAAVAVATPASVSAKEVLVTTEWAAQNAANPAVRIIEVSVNPGLYEQGHIPGAHNVSWHSDLVDTVRRDIVSQEQFEALASRLGITPETTVVLYGDNNNWFAAWGAWIFNVYGHGDVRLVDGGRKKWEAEKRPLDTIPASARATQYQVTQVNSDLRARLPDVVAAAEGKADVKLLDIRSPDEYSGKLFAPANSKELSIRAGHVPGAVNVPWVKAVNEDGTFKSPEELKALYADVGVDGSKPAIVYCRIGERSSHTWFALTQILGYPARQYDGSWTEYGNAVGVPIDNPSGTVWDGK
ncbi:sulfurtransferase [Opitutaceae bacterium TAV5]|nr:sulfurtransferase [Opitutaceae bacterium TAV5]